MKKVREMAEENPKNENQDFFRKEKMKETAAKA